MASNNWLATSTCFPAGFFNILTGAPVKVADDAAKDLEKPISSFTFSIKT